MAPDISLSSTRQQAPGPELVISRAAAGGRCGPARGSLSLIISTGTAEVLRLRPTGETYEYSGVVRPPAGTRNQRLQPAGAAPSRPPWAGLTLAFMVGGSSQPARGPARVGGCCGNHHGAVVPHRDRPSLAARGGCSG